MAVVDPRIMTEAEGSLRAVRLRCSRIVERIDIFPDVALTRIRGRADPPSSAAACDPAMPAWGSPPYFSRSAGGVEGRCLGRARDRRLRIQRVLGGQPSGDDATGGTLADTLAAKGAPTPRLARDTLWRQVGVDDQHSGAINETLNLAGLRWRGTGRDE